MVTLHVRGSLVLMIILLLKKPLIEIQQISNDIINMRSNIYDHIIMIKLESKNQFQTVQIMDHRFDEYVEKEKRNNIFALLNQNRYKTSRTKKKKESILGIKTQELIIEMGN